jgi:mevalonate pyrophosphate decarboxylase
MQLGFYQLAVVGKFVQKLERESYIQKRKQNNTKTQITQNRKQHTKQKNNAKRILKNIRKQFEQYLPFKREGDKCQ